LEERDHPEESARGESGNSHSVRRVTVPGRRGRFSRGSPRDFTRNGNGGSSRRVGPSRVSRRRKPKLARLSRKPASRAVSQDAHLAAICTRNAWTLDPPPFHVTFKSFPWQSEGSWRTGLKPTSRRRDGFPLPKQLPSSPTMV